MRTRGRIYAGIGVILLALGFLMYNGLHSFTQYYLTVGEFTAQERSLVGKPVKVSGRLMPKTVHYNPSTTELYFSIHQGTHVLPVVYQGIRPDNFSSPYARAIVDGELLPSGRFRANKLMVTCPSRYVAANPPASAHQS